MDFSIIAKSSRNLGRVLTKNSPTILTALGVGGLITTVIMAIKATPKALEAIEYEKQFRFEEFGEDKPLEPIDLVEATWKFYLPTTAMGLTTIACMIGANTIHLRRNAALVSLFSITETALREYQAKVVEKIGENKEEKIRGEIAQDTVNNNSPQGRTILVTNKGQNLCFDKLSGRYFYSEIETIRRVVNDFNERLMSEMQITLNELYSDLGLPPIDMGAQTGWDIGKGQVKIFFSANLTPDGQSAIVLEHRNLPTNLWS